MKWSASQKDWLEVDQTEVVHDSLDPEWEHKFSVVLNFGQILCLRFEVLDYDTDGSSQLIGFYETTLSGLIKQREVGQNALQGPHKGKPGFLTIVAQERAAAQTQVNFGLRVSGLPERISIVSCNLATTYFMEIWKGQPER